MEKKELEVYGVPEEHQAKLTELINSEISQAVEGAQNDSEFIQKLRDNETARFYGTVEGKLKKVFGIDLSSIDPELKGVKRFEEILKTGIGTLEKSKDLTNQELQQKNIDLQAAFDTFKDVDHVNAINDLKTTYNKRYIDSKLFEDSSEIEVTVSDKAKVRLIDIYLSDSGITKEWDSDKNDVIFKTKDGLKVTREGKVLSKKEILTQAYEYAGVLKKSNGNENPNNVSHKIVVPNGQTKFSDAAIQKAKEAGVTLPA